MRPHHVPIFCKRHNAYVPARDVQGPTRCCVPATALLLGLHVLLEDVSPGVPPVQLHPVQLRSGRKYWPESLSVKAGASSGHGPARPPPQRQQSDEPWADEGRNGVAGMGGPFRKGFQTLVKHVQCIKRGGGRDPGQETRPGLLKNRSPLGCVRVSQSRSGSWM